MGSKESEELEAGGQVGPSHWTVASPLTCPARPQTAQAQAWAHQPGAWALADFRMKAKECLVVLAPDTKLRGPQTSRDLGAEAGAQPASL